MSVGCIESKFSEFYPLQSVELCGGYCVLNRRKRGDKIDINRKEKLDYLYHGDIVYRMYFYWL